MGLVYHRIGGVDELSYCDTLTFNLDMLYWSCLVF